MIEDLQPFEDDGLSDDYFGSNPGIEYRLYNKNGAIISINPSYQSYFLETLKYRVDWYIDPNNDLYIFNKNGSYFELILKCNKKFDLSLFCEINENIDLEIKFASEEIINSQIERLLKLKGFI